MKRLKDRKEVRCLEHCGRYGSDGSSTGNAGESSRTRG